MEKHHECNQVVLYNNGETWMKKEGGSFDVTMGAYGGTEV